MPDPSLMLPLCGLLHITVNELLTGERISMEDYQKKAEEKLLELQKQEALNNRRLLWLEVVIGLLSTAAALVMIFAASFAVVYFWWRLALIAAGLAILTVGIAVAVKLEHDAGYYECPHCHARYVPTMWAVVFSPHIGRSRKMKCPRCGQRGYHRKILTR